MNCNSIRGKKLELLAFLDFHQPQIVAIQETKIDSSIFRRDVPVGVPLDLSTPMGMSCIGTYGENCKSDNVSKYRVLLVAFLLLA